MTSNLQQDWPLYVLGGIAVLWVLYIIIKSNMDHRKETKKEN